MIKVPAAIDRPRLTQAQEEEMDRMVRHDWPCLDLRMGPALVRRGWALEVFPGEARRPAYVITLAGIQAYLRAVKPATSERAWEVLTMRAKRTTQNALVREARRG
jgi:hypothetical protein